MTEKSEEILRRNALFFVKTNVQELERGQVSLPTEALAGKKLIVAIIEDKR